MASAVGAAAFALGLNGPTILQNLRKLPSEIEATRDQYLDWIKEDAGWTGDWSTFPEGIVNMGDMNLSEGVDLKISILSKHGEIDGMIANANICKNLPIDFLLLRGSVSGNIANVEVWDIVGGHTRVFEKIQLVRDGNVLTVQPSDKTRTWFPLEARLGMHPDQQESFMQNLCNRQKPKVAPH